METNRTQGVGRKIFAFFGSDLPPERAHRILARAHKDGYTLLALDSGAMSDAAAFEVPFVVLEDLLSPEDLYEAHVQADEWGRNWFEAARDEFTVDGFCWPELEIGTMRYFWGNVTLALKLVQTLQKIGTKEFRFFSHFSLRPQVGYGKSDVCAALWQAAMPGVAKPLVSYEELRLSRLFSLARRALRRVRLGARRQAKDSVSAKTVTGRIFLVMGELEALRFSDLLQELSRCFPGTVGVAAAGLVTSDSASIALQESVPVLQGPPPAVESWMPPAVIRLLSRRTKELSDRLMRGYTKSRDSAFGSSWRSAMVTLRFHFEYYCRYRWPRLHTLNTKFWSDMWTSQKPRAVFASAVEDGRFRLVIAAARSKGIRTIGIPHGGVVGTPGHLIRPVVDDLLYSTELQKAVFVRTGFPVSNLYACRGLVASNEYPVIRSQAFSRGSKLRVLALTDTTDEGTNLMKLVGLRAQYTALKALVKPPEDMAYRVEVRVKTHPEYRDLSLIETLGTELLAKVMPAESDLHAALEECDVVVAVNYYGSALIHAFRVGMPVIHLLTVHDSLVNSKLNLFHLFLQGGAIARTDTDFWALIRSILADDGVAQNLRHKAQEFARRNLDDASFPSISMIASSLGLSDGNLGGCSVE